MCVYVYVCYVCMYVFMCVCMFVCIVVMNLRPPYWDTSLDLLQVFTFYFKIGTCEGVQVGVKFAILLLPPPTVLQLQMCTTTLYLYPLSFLRDISYPGGNGVMWNSFRSILQIRSGLGPGFVMIKMYRLDWM